MPSFAQSTMQCYGFLLVLFLNLLPTTSATGQASGSSTLYAASVHSTSNTALSKHVRDPQNAIGNNNSYATIISPLLSVLATEYIRLGFSGTVPAGYTSGFIISTSSAVLNLNLLPIISISTFDSNNKAVQETAIDPGLLAVSLFSGSTQPVPIAFVNSLPYTRMELRVTYPVGLSLGSDFRVYAAFASPPIAPLPVSLTAFKGIATQTGITLHWETASEENNSHFVVQRSADGIVFDSIGTVTGAGSTSIRQKYRFVDSDVAKRARGAYYYRLRQVDHDGTSEYSKAVAIHWQSNTGESGVKLYPNPATSNDAVTIKLSHAPVQDQKAYLFNAEGKLVKQMLLSDQITTMPTTGLSPGLYVLMLPQMHMDNAVRQKILITN